MKKSRKIVGVALVLALALGALIPAAVFAVETGEVSCTVSGKLISATITSDGTVAYGILGVSATQDTVTLTDTQTAKNNGTVAEDLKIKSSSAIGGTQWTLGSSQGANIFTHKASIDGSTWNIPMTEADVYVALKGNVLVDGTQTFDLQIGMPSTITDYSAKTITVTVGASEYTG